MVKQSQQERKVPIKVLKKKKKKIQEVVVNY